MTERKPLVVSRDYDHEQVEHYAFDVRDRKGRLIGASVSLTTATYAFDEHGVVTRLGSFGVLDGKYPTEPAVLFEYRPHATRDGRPYGAFQPWYAFRTEVERTQAIAKYVEGARRRANKRIDDGPLR